MRRIGIISGVGAELSALLPDAARERVCDAPPIHRVEHDGRSLFLACAGIGKVAAATVAGVMHGRFGVELLMVIGTAGKIAAIEGDLFRIDEAVQADFGAQRPDGLVHYTAGRWPIGPATVEAHRALDIDGLDLPTARIATSDLFVECDVHAARVRDKLGVSLVDMETAAVAQAAALLGLPWVAVKATTDGADGDSAGDFVANLDAAARRAADAALRLIALLP